MINWVEFCMKNHLSLDSVKVLSILLTDYMPSFYYDYSHLLDYIYHKSSLAQFIMPFVVCGACKKPFLTDKILCPECSQPLISSCTRCNINKVDYSIDTTMSCNHLDRVEDLNSMLCILYSILEGLTLFNFSTISQHMTSHVADSIHNAGLSVHLTAFITESMYKWNRNDDIQSSNIYKTKIKRVITLVFISLYKSYSSLFESISISHDLKQQLSKSIWNSLFCDDNKLFILLTKHNFQDCYVFSKCDSISYVTGLDIYLENSH